MRAILILVLFPCAILAQGLRPGDPFDTPADEYFAGLGSDLVVSVSMPTNVLRRGEAMVLDVRCECRRNETITVYLPTYVNFQGGRPKPFKVLVLDADSAELGPLVLPDLDVMSSVNYGLDGEWMTIPRGCYVGKRIEVTFSGRVTGAKEPLPNGQYFIQIVFSRSFVVPEPSQPTLTDRDWVQWFHGLQQTEMFRTEPIRIRLED